MLAGVFVLALLSGQRPPVLPEPSPPRPTGPLYEDEASAVELPPCIQGEDECTRYRVVWIDEPTDDDGFTGRWIRYDFDEVTRSVSAADLPYEPEHSLAVRLLLSEIGPDRMLASSEALDEAIGILWTVDNRLDPAVYNPEDRAEAPVFPGCGPEGSFASCADPQQYLGMATWRATDPLRAFDLDLLEPAADLAIRAWYLQERRLVDDPTDGATNYVHRCGGRAYGEPTWRCDGHLGRPAGDIRGANPHTGPIVFFAPLRFSEQKGWYRLRESALVDYVPQFEDAMDVFLADAD